MVYVLADNCRNVDTIEQNYRLLLFFEYRIDIDKEMTNLSGYGRIDCLAVKKVMNEMKL